MCCSLDGSRTKNLSFGERPVWGRVSTMSWPSAPENAFAACDRVLDELRSREILPELDDLEFFRNRKNESILLLRALVPMLSLTAWGRLQADLAAGVQCRANALEMLFPGLCRGGGARHDRTGPCSPTLSLRILCIGAPRCHYRRRRRARRTRDEDRRERYPHRRHRGPAERRSVGSQGLGRFLCLQRQWRNDRNALDRGVWHISKSRSFSPIRSMWAAPPTASLAG